MADQDKIYDSVKSVIISYAEPDDKEFLNYIDNQKTNAHLKDDLNIDSMDLVEIAVELEEQFNIEFENNDIEEIETIGDTIKLIETKIKERKT